jgi:hypothetical protein
MVDNNTNPDGPTTSAAPADPATVSDANTEKQKESSVLVSISFPRRNKALY